MTEPLLGRSVNRLEDERFVRGRGRYIADLVAPNALHGVVVRSPHAHARIAAISVDAARKMPGVAAVLTGAGFGRRQYRPAAVRGDHYSDDHAAGGAALSRAGARRRSLCRRAGRLRGRGKHGGRARCRRGRRRRLCAAAAGGLDRGCRSAGRPGDLAGGARATSRSSSTAARSARWKPRSATPPMSWNANSSTTASSPRRWRRAARWASSMPRAAVCI